MTPAGPASASTRSAGRCRSPIPAPNAEATRARTAWPATSSAPRSITAARVAIDYTGAGIGYAGDPTPGASDIAPLVTVRLTGLTFTPVLGQIFGVSMTLPSFNASLTLEDGVGTLAN